MNEEKVIEVTGLTKKFGKLYAVNDIYINVFRGDIFGFLGPNGAGKSTTIRMLLSLIKPTSGSIKIFGLSLSSNKKKILRRIGAIVEKPDFYLYLSAFQNLEILGRLSGVEITRNKIMDMLNLVGLSQRSSDKVKTFSHGMKQRLGIAQALLHDPELIILDEPTTGLDPQGMKEIRDLITYLSKEKGKTIFLSSHILREVELIANRLIIINKGKAQIEGEVQELLNSGDIKAKFEVNDASKALNVIKESLWYNYFKTTENNTLFFEMPHKEISALNKYLVEHSIEVNAVIPIRSLEDFYLKITEGNINWVH